MFNKYGIKYGVFKNGIKSFISENSTKIEIGPGGELEKKDLIEASMSVPLSGEYNLVVLSHETYTTDRLSGSMSAPTGGSYDPI